MRSATAFILALLLAGCTQFPEVEAAAGPVAAGPAPALVPVDGLLAQAVAGRATPSGQATVEGRAAALRARAARLRARQVVVPEPARLPQGQAIFPLPNG